MNNKDKDFNFEEMDAFIRQFTAWNPEKCKEMLWKRKQKNS